MDKRIIFGGIFVAVIIISSIYLITNWDTAFTTNVNITYPDGCIEEYDGADLISPECIEGRTMVDKSQRGFNADYT